MGDWRVKYDGVCSRCGVALRAGEVAVYERATRYEDPTFFRRLFKRKTGLSPAAYRRKMAGILQAPNDNSATARRR